ncbi:hypothetical protein D3C87_979730 [compost metagenome]
MVAVHQRSHAQVQVAARCNDGAAARARAVDQLARADRNGVAVDAPEVVDAACVDVGRSAVDEAGVRQAVGDIDGVVAPGQQLAAGLVVERGGRDGQVAASADRGAVVHGAADGHAQIAARCNVAGLVERPRVGEGQVLRGLQGAEPLQGLDHDGEAFAGHHLALAVLEQRGVYRRVALGGDFAASVVQFPGGDREVLAGTDGAALVVDAVGDDGDQLAQHALGRRCGGGQRGAVVQAGGVQGQGFVGLDQAAAVVDSAGCGQGQVPTRQRAGGVADAGRFDLHIAGGGDQSGGVVEFGAQCQHGVAGRRQLAALVAQVGGGDVEGAAVEDGVARGDVAGRGQREFADGRQVAGGQVHAVREQGHVFAGRADARMGDEGGGQLDAARQAERAVFVDARDEAAGVGQRAQRGGVDVAARQHRTRIIEGGSGQQRGRARGR